MRNKILLMMLVVPIIIAIVVGVFFRQTYTNVTAEDNVFENFNVALWDLDMSPNLIEAMREDLSNSNLIVRVKANGQVGYTFKNFKHYVEVLEVYQGSELEVGDNIEVNSLNWLFFFDDMSANLGFVNVMQQDQEYLVFLDGRLDTHDPEEKLYTLTDSLVAPVFNYQDKDHTIISVPDDNRYVPYEEVSENEFFVRSEEALSALMEFKHELLQKYPR